MANAPVQMKKPIKATPAPRMGSGQLILWAIAFVGVLFVFTGSVILSLVGMAPTLVALLVDRTPRRYAALCMAGMNFTGVFPSLMKLWDTSITGGVRESIAISFNPFNLTVMYGAAAFGWLLYQVVPPIVAATIAVSAQHRIALLRGRQRELIKEWGDAIAMAAKDDEAKP